MQRENESTYVYLSNQNAMVNSFQKIPTNVSLGNNIHHMAMDGEFVMQFTSHQQSLHNKVASRGIGYSLCDAVFAIEEGVT